MVCAHFLDALEEELLLSVLMFDGTLEADDIVRGLLDFVFGEITSSRVLVENENIFDSAATMPRGS